MPACAHCFKEYKQRTLLIRHERICGITQQSRSIREDESVPSNRDLYEVVLHLVDKVRRLEEKVGRLNVQQQRAWNLEEALGGDIPPHSFREWSKLLAATPRHLENIFEHGRTEGLIEMVTEMIGAQQKGTPLRAFRQRKDTVYAYGDDGKWSKLNKDDWDLFLNTLDKMLRVQFHQWQEANVSQMMQPAFQYTYLTNMRKLNGTANQGEAIKVKRAIYELIMS
jgi:hypothetical protein